MREDKGHLSSVLLLKIKRASEIISLVHWEGRGVCQFEGNNGDFLHFGAWLGFLGKPQQN